MVQLSTPPLPAVTTASLVTCKLNCQQRVVEVGYSPKTEKAIYDICDFDGRVIYGSKLSSQGAEIPYDLLSQGSSYVIWIIDGAEVLKTRFRLDEAC